MVKGFSVWAAIAAVGLSFQVAQATFIPTDHVINFQTLSVGPSNIDEEGFKALMAKFQTTYGPIVSSHGGNLVVRGDWKSETINASAQQMFGTWRVNMYGGLARRPELTPDGLALVMCHEMGHHLAGFSFVRQAMWGEVWAANEGQSDYFATQVCARKIWSEEKEQNATFRDTASPSAKAQCEANWSDENDQNLCLRVLAASESLGKTLANLLEQPVPSFDTPDTRAVNQTDDDHPAAQCRLDTYLNGAICKAQFSESLIPGKKVPAGTQSLDAEKEAANHACTQHSGFEIGLRPLCWFKPRL